MVKRIGISMRTCQAETYRESRDSLAHDWYDYLPYALPETQWLLLPNLGPRIVDYARDWSIDGLLLTGGNDLGEDDLRDGTETALIDFALKAGLPIFGVCRGLHLVQHYFRGELSPCSRDKHVATVHEITFRDSIANSIRPGTRLKVNSYHGSAVQIDQLAAPLQALATSDDGLVEGLYHPREKIVAVQWHPERDRTFCQAARHLIREAFGWTS